jgi:hypothetical protein
MTAASDSRRVQEEMTRLGAGYGIGEPMRRHHVIPLDHPIPVTTEPNPSSLPATKPEKQAALFLSGRPPQPFAQ